jgi:regulator of protease activity HflC (stomatin/prohibitin superfamily)
MADDVQGFLENNWKKLAASAAFGIAALWLGARSYEIVPAQRYAVHVKLGQVKSDQVAPGIYRKLPFYDHYYVFNNNTIILENTVCSGNNTADQNSVKAEIRLHYRINPKVGLLALLLDKMSDDNGAALLGDLMTQACNAVVGSRPARDTLADPQGFLQAFMGNLQWRVSQNNIPAQVDVAELLAFNADLREPVQMRLKTNGAVEDMAGPAAISVTHAGGSLTAAGPNPTVEVARPIPGVTRSTDPTSLSVPKAP